LKLTVVKSAYKKIKEEKRERSKSKKQILWMLLLMEGNVQAVEAIYPLTIMVHEEKSTTSVINAALM
jgi:hypothetical protein